MATPNSDGILLLSLAGVVFPVPVSVVALVMSISPTGSGKSTSFRKSGGIIA